VALIALYPAQVELIRRLVRDLVARTPAAVRVEVGLPSDFHQRECLAALVSLTRSHTHRAVPFGEGPQQLVEALTRAVSRLWVFGDPGTLARRGQWSGPLDHLDESAAERERDLVLRLCQFLTGQTPRAADFRSFEGSGV
jgi:superfamily I DNA and/or RNA helicase